jgi:hypothetical protein
MVIEAGHIEGVDVAGTKVAAAIDWPGAMMAGNGTGRLYFDADTTAEQRQALQTLIDGKVGGQFSRLPELVPTVLAPIIAPIRKESRAGGVAIAVSGYGEAIVKPARPENGEQPRLRGVGGFRDDVMVATGAGSWWRDPELRHWKGGGYAEQSAIDWAG